MLTLAQDMNYAGSTCICRVPKAQLKPGVVVECTHCGQFARPPPRASRSLASRVLYRR
jgi:RNase P subunit RPR2